jgi:hypothetical protein
VLGTIFMGLATPSEAGAMGVVGAIALAASYGTLSWKLLYQGMSTTMRLTAMVVFILIGARVFSLVFQGVGGKEWIEHLLTGLPGGQIGFLIFVNILHLRRRVLPRLLRDRVHHHPAARAGRGEARHRPRLVRRADLRQHPDELHASAVRFRALLSARDRAADDQDVGNLLGSHSLGVPAAHPRRHPDLLAGSVTYWLDKGTGADPSKVNIEVPLPEMPPPIDSSAPKN